MDVEEMRLRFNKISAEIELLDRPIDENEVYTMTIPAEVKESWKRYKDQMKKFEELNPKTVYSTEFNRTVISPFLLKLNMALNRSRDIVSCTARNFSIRKTTEYEWTNGTKTSWVEYNLHRSGAYSSRYSPREIFSLVQSFTPEELRLYFPRLDEDILKELKELSNEMLDIIGSSDLDSRISDVRSNRYIHLEMSVLRHVDFKINLLQVEGSPLRIIPYIIDDTSIALQDILNSLEDIENYSGKTFKEISTHITRKSITLPIISDIRFNKIKVFLDKESEKIQDTIDRLAKFNSRVSTIQDKLAAESAIINL